MPETWIGCGSPSQTRVLDRIDGWIAVGALLLGEFAPEGPRTDCAWHALPA